MAVDVLPFLADDNVHYSSGKISSLSVIDDFLHPYSSPLNYIVIQTKFDDNDLVQPHDTNNN